MAPRRKSKKSGDYSDDDDAEDYNSSSDSEAEGVRRKKRAAAIKATAAPGDSVPKAVRAILDSIEVLEAAGLFLQLPDREEYPDYYNFIKNPISLEEMAAKEYNTLGEFSEDFYLMISNAKEYNQKGSAVYNDAVTLANKFEKLLAPYARTMDTNVGARGLGKRTRPSVDEKGTASLVPEGATSLEQVEINGVLYKIGDFAYLTPASADLQNDVGCVVAIYSLDGKTTLVINRFFHPYQTVHTHGRKFAEREVFKTHRSEAYAQEEVRGKCFVLHFKDYIRGSLPGIDPKHVFVCESRFNEAAKALSKIKVWPTCLPEQVRNIVPELNLYDFPLTLEKFSLPGEESEAPDAAKRKRDDDEHSGSATAGAVPSGKRRAGTRLDMSYKDFPVSESSSVTGTPTIRKRTNPVPQGRPVFFLPRPIHGPAQLSEGLVSDFDHGDGTIRWFSSPPIDVVPGAKVAHSAEYLAWKAEQLASKPVAKQSSPKKNASPKKQASPVKPVQVEAPGNGDPKALVTALYALSKALGEDAMEIAARLG